MDLEWQGNEIYFTSGDKETLILQAFGAFLAIRQQLHQKYYGNEFDIFLSIREEEMSARLRFCAVREGRHYIEPSIESLEGFAEEAVLLDNALGIDLKKILERVQKAAAGYEQEISGGRQQYEIAVKNPFGEPHLYIYLDDELTLCFDSYHAHYDYDDGWDWFLGDLKGLLSGKYAVMSIESGGRWLGSRMGDPQEAPVSSKSGLLRFMFGNIKDFIKRVKNDGGTFTITAWGIGGSKKFLIDGNGVKPL